MDERRQIRARRVLRGWTQAQLGEAAGVAPGTISRIERGHPCTLDVMERLAAALECAVGDLL